MIGVIADDLSGAAELGALGLRHGLCAEVLLSGRPGRKADLVCVDTDSRGCAPEEAGRRTAAAARLLIESGVRWIYKKTDSVLRGQVTAELEALLESLEADRAILVPANPGLGRTIASGRYYIHGRPIHRTEFARDPDYPRASAKVLDLLKRPMRLPIVVCQMSDTPPPRGIVMGEARSAEHLRYWARFRSAKSLAAGGAEFFGALLADESVRKSPARRVAGGKRVPQLFVCGSTSEATQAFIRQSRRQGVPVFTLPVNLAAGAEFTVAARRLLAREARLALRRHDRVVLAIGLPLVREQLVARALSSYLVQVAVSALRHRRACQVFAEGGATAVELARGMGWTRMTVRNELGPGVATLTPPGRRGFRLTVKPGSYRWPPEVRKHVLR